MNMTAKMCAAAIATFTYFTTEIPSASGRPCPWPRWPPTRGFDPFASRSHWHKKSRSPYRLSLSGPKDLFLEM